MNRNQFYSLIIFSLCVFVNVNLNSQVLTNKTSGKDEFNSQGKNERKFFISVLTKIANPVLDALSKNELKKQMPVEAKPGLEADRKHYTYLEAFGRLLAGMAPWLELGPDNTPERKLREKYIVLSIKCIHNATDPESPDFMNFNKGGQPLVDAAFLCQAFLRAPHQL